MGAASVAGEVESGQGVGAAVEMLKLVDGVLEGGEGGDGGAGEVGRGSDSRALAAGG